MILTGLLRTLVPALWGAMVAWLIGFAPLLAPMEAHLLGLSEVILPVITALIIGAWYAFWRWLEPRLPDWVTRAVLGSARTPVYPGRHVATENQVPSGDLPTATK